MANSSPQPLCLVPHYRVPWEGNEQVYVCARLTALTGEDGAAERRAEYGAAKLHGDYDAAAKLVKLLVSDGVVDRLIDDLTPQMVKGTPLVCVVPHPPFDDLYADGADLVGKPQVKNALPIQYMAHLATLLDAERDYEIVQKGRVGRTKLTRMERLRWQPYFEGAVRPDVAYILVDDVLTTGGTLAALRSYILSQGGKVAGYTTLAHGAGQWRRLALTRPTWVRLEQLYGPELSEFWNREIGHDAESLTETEGRSLARWAEEQGRGGPPILQRLRDCLAKATAEN